MRQVCKCFSPGRGETRLWQISTPLSLDCCSILQRSMQRKTESTFLIRHQLFGFAMATVIITIKAQIYFDTSFFFPLCTYYSRPCVCVWWGIVHKRGVSVCSVHAWLVVVLLKPVRSLWAYREVKELSILSLSFSSFFHFFEGTFVGGGKKSIKMKRKGEINDKNRRYNALFAIMATILCISIFNLRSYTIEMGSIVRQRLVLFTCRHLQLENVTPRA